MVVLLPRARKVGNSHDTALRIVMAQSWSSAAMRAMNELRENPALPARSSGSVCQPSDLARHDVHDDLLHHARAMTYTTVSADFAEPGPAVRGDGPLVEVVDIQDDTAQPQDIEGVPGQQGDGLRCISTIPAVLLADDDSQLGRPFRVVDIEECTVAYQAHAVHLMDVEVHAAPISLAGVVVIPLVFVLDGHACSDVGQPSVDFGVADPLPVRRHVLPLPRGQCDFRAVDDNRGVTHQCVLWLYYAWMPNTACTTRPNA